MNIVYLLNSLEDFDGVKRIIIDKATLLAERKDYIISIVLLFKRRTSEVYNLTPKISLYRLNVQQISFTKNPIKARCMERNIVRQLDKLLLNIKPDVIIGTEEWGIPPLTELKYNCIKIWEAHRPKQRYIESRKYAHKALIGNAIKLYKTKKMNLIERKCDYIVTLTKKDASEYKKAKNIKVIPNFTKLRNDEKPDLDSKRCISVGRLCYQKGFDRLIKAWKLVNIKHPDWTIHIFGEGELRDKLLTLIRQHSLQNTIILEGSTSNVKEELLKSAFFVWPSRFEGFGLAGLEAQACALPIVTFNYPNGADEIVDDDINGIVVPDNDIEALADAICNLIEDKEKLKAFSIKAKEKYLNVYTPDSVMKQWDVFFHDIIDRN